MTPRPLIWNTFASLLCIWMLMPTGALAAGDAPRLSRLSLLSEPGASQASADTWEEPEPQQASRELRILAEVGAGAVTSLGGGFVGGFGGFALCANTGLGRGGDFLPCLGTALVGAGAGLVLGYPLGVWWGGEAMGGDGRLWASMLGTVLGFGVGLPLVLEEGPFALAPIVLGMAGASIGYELTQNTAPSHVASARPRLQPLLSVSDKGALLGLGGAF
ncbi:hypothetical protein [Melittangium boletus]|uniref:Uncharacterized protein n=1 Tax=Melittangium boletus DSM 14713 TaxID=1294270 RepID=A0A250IQ37_9BACT|nr:hypothetical protein [Melittangium boletus]ATB33281.1 hypothetical protein MEBOL_006772 [Melittangium boletus DSM 14713]